MVFWGWYVVSGQRSPHYMTYLLLLGFYAMASAAFVFSRIKGNNLRFFDIPVFLTIVMCVEFGIAPLECFLTPSQMNLLFEENYDPLIKALSYVICGMVAFCAGCGMVKGSAAPTQNGRTSVPSQEGYSTRRRILGIALGVSVVVFAVNYYMLTHHLYAYLGSKALYRHNLAIMQVLVILSGLGTCALIIAGIERYQHPSDHTRKLFFIAIFASQCFWGLISGMKGLLFENFLVVALISSLVQQKFRKGWVIAALVGLIAFYPLSNAYRQLITEHGERVTSVNAGVRVGMQAFTMTSGGVSGPLKELKEGWRNTLHRLDLLQSVGLVISMGPRASQLLGSARIWMLSFYPFIPRLIWPSKPRLNEDWQFSVMLGYGTSVKTVRTSTAVTYPGDLYARGGLLGIIAGMFVLGVVSQWLTNSVTRRPDKRSLFIYASLFLMATDMEVNAFAFWSNLIRWFVILTVAAWLVYGPRRGPSRARTLAGNGC